MPVEKYVDRDIAGVLWNIQEGVPLIVGISLHRKVCKSLIDYLVYLNSLHLKISASSIVSRVLW